MKMTPVLKITTAAMFMCLAIIFNKLLVIQMLPSIPFVRIGIGALPVMIASVVLGPIYGGVVGAASDVIGYFLFDISGFAYTPFATISMTVLGVAPYFLFMATKRLRYKKNPLPLSVILMGAIFVFLLVFVLSTDTVTVSHVTYNIDIYWKIFVPVISAAVFSLFSLFVYYTNRRFQKRIMDYPDCPSPQEVAFMVLLLEIVINMFWGAFWKSLLFKVDYMVVWFSQAIILVFAFPIKTFILTYLFMAYYRYVDKARSNKVD